MSCTVYLLKGNFHIVLFLISVEIIRSSHVHPVSIAIYEMKLNSLVEIGNKRFFEWRFHVNRCWFKEIEDSSLAGLFEIEHIQRKLLVLFFLFALQFKRHVEVLIHESFHRDVPSLVRRRKRDLVGENKLSDFHWELVPKRGVGRELHWILNILSRLKCAAKRRQQDKLVDGIRVRHRVIRANIPTEGMTHEDEGS